MPKAVGREALVSTCALTLLIGGCPKRQPTPHIVYSVPRPAAPATASAQPQQEIVIEEPAPPDEQPPQVPAPEVTTDKSVRPRKRVVKTEPQTTTAEPPEEPADTTPEPPPAEVPALEPRESSAQVSVLRQQVQTMQEDVRGRLARINEAKLSPEDRKTLDDARTFFTQSNKALDQGDLQRALNLARKASLLVTALEQ